MELARMGAIVGKSLLSSRRFEVGGSRLFKWISFGCECMAHGQIWPWRMPRAACSHAHPGKRPSVRTEAPDEAKPRPSAQHSRIADDR